MSVDDALERTGNTLAAAPGPDADTAPAADGPDQPPRRRRARRLLIAFGVLVLVVVLVVGGGAWFLTERYAGNVHRITDAFSGIDETTRPAPATQQPGESAPPVTFPLLGSDTRGHPGPGEDPGSRSDATMLVRFSGDRQHAQVISIPRDSWVPIPDHGTNKINAA